MSIKTQVADATNANEVPCEVIIDESFNFHLFNSITSDRLKLYKFTIESILDNLWLGKGLGTWSKIYFLEKDI